MHWVVLIGVFMLLFGAKRMPDAARSLGRSMRILKAELNADGDGVEGDSHAESVPAPAAPLSYTAPTVVAPSAAVPASPPPAAP